MPAIDSRPVVRRAEAPKSVLGCGHHFRMLGEPEVVVGTGHDQPLSGDRDLGAVVLGDGEKVRIEPRALCGPVFGELLALFE